LAIRNINTSLENEPKTDDLFCDPFMKIKIPTNAFVLRQSPSGVSQLESISLPENVIVNGWSAAPGLIEEKDRWEFRGILRRNCYPNDKSLRRAGYASSTMWRFINEMKLGDWVVVPHRNGTFYVAEITGDAYHDGSAAAMNTDTSYRRAVYWLNNKSPIPRRLAKSRLISRMKTQQTSANARDLVEQIYEALELARAGGAGTPTLDTDQLFADQLRLKMVEAVLAEIRQGYMDNVKFEHLVRRIVLANGATDAKIIGRRDDKGVDIIATFPIGRVGQIEVGIQAKHHIGKTETKWIDQLIKGMEEEDLSFGWFVTSATFEDSAEDHLGKRLAGTAMQVWLVDGDQLASLIIDSGLENVARITTP
jgi:predicted Mrr-cat superfamily restriction endonuclease